MWPQIAKLAVRWLAPSVLIWIGGDAVEKSATAVGENLVTPATDVLGVNQDGTNDWRINLVSIGLVSMALSYAYGKIFGKDV